MTRSVARKKKETVFFLLLKMREGGRPVGSNWIEEKRQFVSFVLGRVLVLKRGIPDDSRFGGRGKVSTERKIGQQTGTRVRVQ